MAARLESSDGTTLAMMMPSTPGESRDASAKRLRRRTPHSSAVWPCTVRSRHWLTRRRRSKAPMVMLLLPTSRASSIMFVAHGAAREAAGPRGHPQGPAPQLYWADSSSEYKGFRAVVRAQFQEAGGIEARGGAGDDAAGLFDAHAFAARVVRSRSWSGARTDPELADGRLPAACGKSCQWWEAGRSADLRASTGGLRRGAAKWLRPRSPAERPDD